MGGKSNHFDGKNGTRCKVLGKKRLQSKSLFYVNWIFLYNCTSMRKKNLLIAVIFLQSIAVFAQNIGVGQWKAHLNQNDPIKVFLAAPYVYGWTSTGFCRYHLGNKETQSLSKIDGYTEVGVRYAAYNESLKTLVIAYNNSNIDLQLPSGEIYNVPDLINAKVNGSKEVAKVSFYDEYAFFSAGFGILVYNLNRKESSADYKSDLIKTVRSTEVFNSFVYAATDHGLFRAPLPTGGISIAASAWSQVDTGNFRDMVQSNGKLYLWKDSAIYTYDGTAILQVLANKEIRDLKAFNNEVYMTSNDGVYLLHESPVGFYELEGSRSSFRYNAKWYYASFGYGILEKSPNDAIEFLSPGGPYGSGVGKMVSKGNTIYIAGGTMKSDGGVTYSSNGYYTYTEGKWSSSYTDNIPYIDTMYDIHAMCLDPTNGDLWVAALEQGMARIRNKQVIEFYDDKTSPIQLRVTKLITSLAMDKNRNLWVTNFAGSSPLLVKSPSGVWDSFPQISGQAGGVLEMVIDRSGQKWIRFADGLGVTAGILVYNDNNTPFDKSDDPFPTGKILSSAGGNGNLPDNQVNCMAVDRNGQIWVGTDKGLTVFYTPSNITSSNPSDARQIVIGSGDDVGYLLGEEAITAILVDGGNRKWIAARSGLWLVSPDGQEILAHYNETNSPLFSNEITELGMVERTGELFVATSKGLMSLGTNSSVGADKHGDVKVYPNPVRPGYTGEISITGLPTDAYVKITDVAGTLIYETRANGGTASWDGKSFDGRKASTGVFLIFTGNNDGSDTFVSKLLIVN